MTATTRIKSFLSQPRLVLNSLLLFIFSAAWLRELLYWLPKDVSGNGLDLWVYTDWLIDYSQGFIRRGLSGEIFHLVPAAIPRMEFVAVFSWILILAVAFGYLRLLARSWKSLHPLTMFGLLFLPSLFFFYLHNHSAIGRKEILGYVPLLLHLLVVEKSFPIGGGSPLPDGSFRRYIRGLLPVALILLPAVILVHEGNFLLFVPVHAMITLSVLRMDSACSFIRAILRTGLLYLPAALALGAVFLAGTPSMYTAVSICQEWKAAGALGRLSCFMLPDPVSGSTLPGSFFALTWSLSRAVEITRMVIPRNLDSWIRILLASGICLGYIVRQTLYSILRSRSQPSFAPKSAMRYTILFFGKYFLIPLIFSLPIYFTALDYGRWFAVTCINFVLVAVSANLPLREFARRPKGAEEGSPAIDSPEHADPRLVFYAASAAICILALVLWLPHFCQYTCEIIRSPLQFFDLTYLSR